MRTRSVLLCMFDDMHSLDFTGPLEVFSGANTILAARQRPPAYTVATGGIDGAPVHTSSGLCVTPDTDLSTADAPHTLVVPGGEGRDWRPEPRLVDWVRRVGTRAARIASVCTGAAVLAAAGLLDGRRVTTHRGACATLAALYPAVEVVPEPVFVRDGKFVTSAGVATGIDMALALVDDDLGTDVALAVAQYLEVVPRKPGGVLVPESPGCDLVAGTPAVADHS